MPERIQLRRHRGYRKPAGVVVVTRGTDWGNPFVVGRGVRIETPNPYDKQARDRGDWWVWQSVEMTPAIAVALFRAWIEWGGFASQIRADLAGRDLACWCRLDQPCHADVLLEVAND
jgi:hypothetical protein